MALSSRGSLRWRAQAVHCSRERCKGGCAAADRSRADQSGRLTRAERQRTTKCSVRQQRDRTNPKRSDPQAALCGAAGHAQKDKMTKCSIEEMTY